MFRLFNRIIKRRKFKPLSMDEINRLQQIKAMLDYVKKYD